MSAVALAGSTSTPRRARRAQVAPARQLCLFPSELGWCGVVCGEQDTLQRIWFGYPSRASLAGALEATGWEECLADVRAESAAAFRTIVRRIRDYAQGIRVDFSDLPIDVGPRTDFQRAVLRVTRRLPYGETASYGEIARRAGAAGAARAVGSVMAHNPLPLVIPCHRVIAAGQRLGGFSAIDGVALKRRLLLLEGAGAIKKTGALTSVR